VSGIIILIKNIRLSRNVFFGLETSSFKQLAISILFGLAVSLLFLSGILIAGILDDSYEWTKNEIIIVGILLLAFLIFLTLGSFLLFFIIGKFRMSLIKKWQGKNVK